MKPPILTDLEAERDYLAAMLVYGNRDWVRSTRLDPADLFSPAHQDVLIAIREIETKTGEISIDAVIAHLKNIGSKNYKKPAEITDGYCKVPTRTDLESIVDRIRKLAECRQINERLEQARSCFAKGELQNGKDYVRLASEALDSDHSGYVIEDIGASMRYAFDTIANERRKKVRFGAQIFTDSIGFLSAGSAMTIGGKTSAGKSTIALDVAKGMAGQGHRPGIISLEDGPDVWGSRFLSSLSGLPVSYAKTGQAEADGVRTIMDTSINAAPDVVIAYARAASPETVLGLINRLVRSNGCDVIFVDYLQAIHVDLKTTRVDKSYSFVFNRMKAMADNLGVPVIVLSQIRRMDGEEPTMYDLKETGDVENGSEVVALVWFENSTKNTYVKTDKIKWARRDKYLRARVVRDSTGGMITGYEMAPK